MRAACRPIAVASGSMVERLRRGGTCNKCGGQITEVVDDMYVAGQVAGVDEPYDSIVVRARCSPGCTGPDLMDELPDSGSAR
jgi:hypothetical protein